jgi:DNA-binding LacI/PurR family transcriptional regulator
VATIKDVARAAGVSIGTVSAVLNGSTTIKEENRKKIFAAVEKLNYKPNMAARTLKTGTSKSIGLLIPDITNPFYPELARGVEDAARKEGVMVFLCNNDRAIEKEREYVSALVAKNVDGIIMVKPQIPEDELKTLAGSCHLVLVDPSSRDSYEKYDVIKVADRSGARAAMDLLIGFGHERIAYISGRMESISAIERFDAYKQALDANKIKLNQDYIRHTDYDWLSGYSAAFDLLRMPDRPTAVFAANDMIAFGVMKALRERNIGIPKDISVIGFDDIDQASCCAPPLTTVRQPKYEIGVKSVSLLFDRIKGLAGSEPVRFEFETELIVRETVNYASTVINAYMGSR